MSLEIESYRNQSPAVIYRKLSTHIEDTVVSVEKRDNIEIIIDMHWFFIHSKYHKQNFQYTKHIGKWKYFATSDINFYGKIFNLIPFVAEGKLPVIKFTNLGNVFSNEKTIVIYCFPFGPTPKDAKSILIDAIGENIIWGSKIFKEE